MSAPVALLAHLVPTGLGPWGDGMARLVLQPTDLLLVVALVLLAAQGPWVGAGRMAVLLPLAWFVGALVGLGLPAELPLGPACAFVIALFGALVTVAAGARLDLRAVRLLGGGAALLFGLAAGSALAGHGGALPALAGEAVAIAVLSVLLLLPLAPPQPRWLAFGLRVIGSWISAAGLLMLGWLARHPF